jgi:hypothetical protein
VLSLNSGRLSIACGDGKGSVAPMSGEHTGINETANPLGSTL